MIYNSHGIPTNVHLQHERHELFVRRLSACLFAWGLTALTAQIGYIAA